MNLPAPAAPTQELLEAFGEFLRLNVAEGDASPDTLTGYWRAVQAWVDWCEEAGVNPATATEYDVRAYRHHMIVDQDLKPATIRYRLTVVRRLYQAAVQRGLRRDNPAAGVRAPKRSTEEVPFLTQEQLQAVYHELGSSESGLRDRVILGLMGLQGLRTIEVRRANTDDVLDDGSMRVRGKGGKTRLIYLRPDMERAIRAYLSRRQPALPDQNGIPLVTNLARNLPRARMSRRGIQGTVDRYLKLAGVKRRGLSAHALRHTYATLAYAATRDLRAVQDDLGHASPRTTARYAHIVDRRERSPAAAISVSLGGND